MFGLFNEIAKPASGGGGGPTFDPTTLSLTGYWRNFTAAPWVGTASTGASSGRTLSAVGGSDPTLVSGAAHFDPAASPSQYLRDGTNTMGAYISSTAYTVSCLLKPNTALSAGANPYNNPSIFGEIGGNFGVEYSDAGVELFHYSGGYKVVTKALATGTFALVDAKYDGVNIKIRVNGGSWTSLAAGSLSIDDSQVRVGRNFASVFLAADILELLVSNTAISDGDLDSYRTGWIDPTYGLAL